MNKEERREALKYGRYCRDSRGGCGKCKYFGRENRDVTCLGLLVSDLVDALADEMEENADD